MQFFEHEVIIISIPGIRIWDDLRHFYIIPGLKIELKKKDILKNIFFIPLQDLRFGQFSRSSVYGVAQMLQWKSALRFEKTKEE